MSSPIINFVDDDQSMLDIYSEIAQLIKLPYACYANASDYLAERSRLDGGEVLILDLSMPDVDGFEVLKNLRSDVSMPALILVSGFDEQLLDSAIRLAQSYGFTIVDSIKKPVDINVLEGKIKAFVRFQDQGQLKYN